MQRRHLNSLTYGAMVCAMTGALLLLNRYLAGVLDSYLFWIVPLPVIAYVLKFGLRDALVMGVALVLTSFIVATPATVVYVVAALVAGLVYGQGVLAKRSSAQLIMSVIAVSLVLMVITVFLASGFFGYDVSEEIAYLAKLITDYQKAASDKGLTLNLPAYFTGTNFLMSIFVISMVLSSVLEGILVHLLAIIVLKRLKMPLPPVKPISQIYAPQWVKLYVFTCIAAYLASLITKITQYDEIITPLMVIATFLACAFGYILMLSWLTINVPDRKRRTAIVAVVIVLLPFTYSALLALGLVDMFTPVRRRMLERSKTDGRQNGPL